MLTIGPEHIRALGSSEAAGAHVLLRHPLGLLGRTAQTGGALGTLRKLRPTKVRNAVRRRWFEWRMSQLVLRDAPGLANLGSRTGGWVVPFGLLASGWTCYCFGAGGDVSFDLALMLGASATVRSFDPMDRYVEAARDEVGPGLPFNAYPVALATVDEPIRLQLTHHPNSEAVSSDGLFETNNYVERDGRRLETLMAELGDPRVELLKVDIEGAEYRVVPELDLAAAGVHLFSVQLHHNGRVREARRLIDGVRAKGYELVACRPAVKLTFARRDLLAPPGV